jgi:heme/copper-type cytochrome/quinol oxidase subunit 2
MGAAHLAATAGHPAVGTLLPLLLAGVNHALAPVAPASGAGNRALLLWDYMLIGIVALHWTLVLTVAIGCFIVRVMKGPAYVADAYPLPGNNVASMTRP